MKNIYQDDSLTLHTDLISDQYGRNVLERRYT